MTVPVQEFQIGQRVRPHGESPFLIHYIRLIDGKVAYSRLDRPWYFASALTLAPERPPYVPTERRYRCETDAELAARHAIERAEYDCPCPSDPVIYNARGESIGISGRTSLDGPSAP